MYKLKKLKKQFLKKAIKIHGIKYNYTNIVYKGSSHKILITCKKHGYFLQTPVNHIRGWGCSKCGLENRTTDIDTFINNANKKHNYRYHYDKTTFNTTSDKTIITCRLHGDFKQRVSSHLNGVGCKKCVIDKQKTTLENFINKSSIVHNNAYTYKKVVYVNDATKVLISCNKHNDFLQSPNNHLNGRGCPKCRSSRGETNISRFLDNHKIKYIKEYNIIPYRFRYDFYLPDLNILIEYDGKQHFKSVKYWGGERDFKIRKKRDLLKNKLAKKHNINLIRIKYDVNDVEDYLAYFIGRLYKYKIGNVFYTDIKELNKYKDISHNAAIPFLTYGMLKK